MSGDCRSIDVSTAQVRPSMPYVASVYPMLLDGLAHEVGNVDVGLGGDLARDDRHAGRHQRLTRHAARRIPREDGVEDGVGDLVGDLVGVAFGDRLGREDVTLGCGHRSGSVVR